jgi:CRISPR system Cascade subunit CasD
MRALILRWEAPMLSFGGVTVDEHDTLADFPGLSQIAGMLGNALGYDHADREALQALQDGLCVASTSLRINPFLRDFQTAAYTSGEATWTTRGRPEGRGVSGEREGQIIRRRKYHADHLALSAIMVTTQDPSLDRLAQALQAPARPLFLGRKPCLPAEPLFFGFADGETLLACLRQAAVRLGETHRLPLDPQTVLAEWPADLLPMPARSQVQRVEDVRNWRANMHTGWRLVRRGLLFEDTTV